jgi:glucosylceramidase
VTRTRRHALLVLTLSVALAGTAVAAPVTIASWVTSADGRQRLAPGATATFDLAPVLPVVVDVDPTVRYQAWAGVGAAFTDASAWVLTRSLAPEARERLLGELFGRGTGLHLSLTRVAIGASDFSEQHYTLDDPADGAPDPTLRAFDFAAGGAPVLPLLRRARELNPTLKVFAAGWSAPAWMKDSGKLIRGRLRPEYHAAYADYLARVADGYAAAGVPLYGLTLQNEPDTEPPDYPGMRVDAAERARLFADALAPRLAGDPAAPRLYDWDHNWDKPAAPLAVLDDPAAAATLSGVAWHCYYGNVAAQGVVHDLHPDKEAWLTECSGGGWSPDWAVALRYFAGTVLIDAARPWARGVILWNHALDETHGPHLGGCRNCRGVVTVDSRTGEITRNVEYYALGHLSKFVRPGAVRIASTSPPGTLRTVAFLNIDDGSVALVVCNDGADAEFSVRVGESAARYALAAGSVATLTWTPARGGTPSPLPLH